MKYKKVIILLLIGLGILAAMVIFVGPGEIFTALQKADMHYVILAIALQFLIMGIWTVRWGIICKELDIPFKKFQLFLMLLVGLAMNNLTPSGRGGGEPVRAYILSKCSNAKFRNTFATVLGDKLLDTFPFLLLAILATIYLIYYLHVSQAIYITLLIILALFVAACVFVVYLCINEKVGIKTVKWVFRQLRRVMKRDLDGYENRGLGAVTGFQQSVRYLIGSRRILTEAIPLSFLVWFLELLRVYIVFLAFGTQVSLGIIAAVFLLATLIGMIPALPGGVGAVDGMMVILYSMAGVSPSVSTAVTLVERLISYWMVSILGLLTLPYFGTDVVDEATNQESKMEN